MAAAVQEIRTTPSSKELAQRGLTGVIGRIVNQDLDVHPKGFLDDIRQFVKHKKSLDKDTKRDGEDVLKDLGSKDKQIVADHLKGPLIEQIREHRFPADGKADPKLVKEDKKIAEALGLLKDKQVCVALGLVSNKRRNALIGAAATITLGVGALGISLGRGVGRKDEERARARQDLIPASPTPEPAASPPTAPSPSPRELINPPTPETKPAKGGLFKDILGLSLYTHILKLRKARESDSEYLKSIDQEINRGRVNILFLAEGTETEQLGEHLLDGIMMVSWGLAMNEALMVSQLRDLHAPEIDRFKQERNMPYSPKFNAINTAYWASLDAYKDSPEQLQQNKFDLIRDIMEHSTGLSSDLIIKTTITGFINFIGNTFGTVEVDIKDDVVKYPDKVPPVIFPRGKQQLTGKELLIYASSRKNTSDSARNSRMQELVEVFFDNFGKRWEKSHIIGKGLLVKNIADSLQKEIDSGQIECSFDAKTLIGDQLYAVTSALTELGSDVKFDKPTMSKLVLDQKAGVVPESRANAPGPDGTPMRPHLVTVEGGNHKAPDLIDGYWQKFRSIVRSRILSQSASFR